MKQLNFLLMATALTLLCSCKNDIEKTQTGYFPNHVGDKWLYRLSGSNNGTIQVNIVGQGILPNGDNACIWQYIYKYTTLTYYDTVWVSGINNDVRMYDKPCLTCNGKMPNERIHYILPLSVGNSWYTNADYGDTTRVDKQLNINVPSGIFENVFQLSKVKGNVTNSWTKDTIYFKDHIGLIKFNQNEYNMGPVIGNGNWELESYHIQ